MVVVATRTRSFTGAAPHMHLKEQQGACHSVHAHVRPSGSCKQLRLPCARKA